MNAIPSASSVQTVHVPLGERAYDILIGPGLIARAGAEIASRLKGRKAAVVTDENVAPLYLKALVASLEQEGIASAAVIRCSKLLVFSPAGRTTSADTMPA